MTSQKSDNKGLAVGFLHDDWHLRIPKIVQVCSVLLSLSFALYRDMIDTSTSQYQNIIEYRRISTLSKRDTPAMYLTPQRKAFDTPQPIFGFCSGSVANEPRVRKLCSLTNRSRKSKSSLDFKTRCKEPTDFGSENTRSKRSFWVFMFANLPSPRCFYIYYF